MTLLLCQFQLINLKAAELSAIDDEELPAIDPFAGGVGSTNQAIETGDPVSTNNGFLNNMRLVGTILGKNKKLQFFHHLMEVHTNMKKTKKFQIQPR